MFKVVYDIGKPYEETYETETDLRFALKSFYREHIDNDEPFDIFVYDEKGEDITDSQLISEMVEDIGAEQSGFWGD